MKEQKVLQALTALAQESRLAIFRLLMEKGGGLPAGTISDQLGIPATTTSFHLSQLKNAGLIESQRDGRSVIYSANRKRAKRMAKYILAKQDEGDGEYNL